MLTRRFNYLIVDVFYNGKEYLLDATEPSMKFNELPFRCINGKGLIMKENSEMWADLLRNEHYDSKVSIQLSLNSELNLEGKIRKSLDSYSAFNIRKKIETTSLEQYVDNIKKNSTSENIDGYSIENIDNPDKKLEISYNFKSKESLDIIENKIFINPLYDKNYESNPFKNVTRHYPVDLGVPIKETVMAVFQIPNGYTVESLPNSAMVQLPENAGNFSFSVTQQDDKVTITSRLSINKVEFSVEEYPFLKEFFDHIINNQSQQIVLKKI